MIELIQRFNTVRELTLALVRGLSAEDCMLQSMPEASPVKWHLAHTTWFFETFVLERLESNFKPFDPSYRVLFNSYYVGVGARHPRSQRGLLSRPSLAEVLNYRIAVEKRLCHTLASQVIDPILWNLVELGIQHEQQHQELILTDLLHHFACNPLLPAYSTTTPSRTQAEPLQLKELAGGQIDIGHNGQGFAFDNEQPRHTVWLDPYAIGQRPINQGEYLAFIEDGGYQRADLWLSEGWDLREREGWRHPLYWHQPELGESWKIYGLQGLQSLDAPRPVCNLSYYEADAYARWAGARLPTEAEWEHAAETMAFDCAPQVWQWTQSAYLPYPGFRVAAGAVGEYNGKFMINQMVLRGGSFATPQGHSRISYRNFFPAHARWQFAGLRLAKNL